MPRLKLKALVVVALVFLSGCAGSPPTVAPAVTTAPPATTTGLAVATPTAAPSPAQPPSIAPTATAAPSKPATPAPVPTLAPITLAPTASAPTPSPSIDLGPSAADLVDALIAADSNPKKTAPKDVASAVAASLASDQSVAAWVACFSEGGCWDNSLGDRLATTTVSGGKVHNSWDACTSSDPTSSGAACPFYGVALLLAHYYAVSTGAPDDFTVPLTAFVDYIRTRSDVPENYRTNFIDELRDCRTGLDATGQPGQNYCTTALY